MAKLTHNSNLEELMLLHIKLAGLPEPVREYKFDVPENGNKRRLWRFDFAYLKPKIAIEVEGGCWVKGRHNRGSGFIADCEKYNKATLLGWKVFRFTKEMISSGLALQTVEKALR